VYTNNFAELKMLATEFALNVTAYPSLMDVGRAQLKVHMGQALVHSLHSAALTKRTLKHQLNDTTPCSMSSNRLADNLKLHTWIMVSKLDHAILFLALIGTSTDACAST
jgi:hypothetical protein